MKKYSNLIFCPNCKFALINTYSSKRSLIYKCNCTEYPEIDGILYLKNDIFAKRAVKLIHSNEINKALTTLLNVRRMLQIPVRLLFLDTNIYKLIGFKNSLRILGLFSYPKNWTHYLLQRKVHTSFRIAKRIVKDIRKGSVVLDFGSGPGNLIPYILKKINAKHLHCLDYDFLNLLIARKFFATKGVRLICANIKTVIPFNNANIDYLIAVDSFHYIKNKKVFLKECHRILKKNSQVSIIHTINSSKKVFDYILGITVNNLTKILKIVGFRKIIIYNDLEFLNKQRYNNIVKNNVPYTFFATK